MQITASGLVHDAHSTSPHQCSSSFTDIAITGDGTVLVTFRAGSERDSLDGHILLYAGNGLDGAWILLYDGYEKGAWEDGTPGEVKTLSLVETGPGVLTATGLWVDRSRLVPPVRQPSQSGHPAHAHLPLDLHRRRTHVEPTSPYGRSSPPRSFSRDRGGSFALPNGVLAQPYETWKDYHDDGPPDQGAYLRLSHDGAKNVAPVRHHGQAPY